MSEWAIKMAVLLAIIGFYCVVMMIKSPPNSHKERLYLSVAIAASLLMFGATFL